jgi:hypothetical protein
MPYWLCRLRFSSRRLSYTHFRLSVLEEAYGGESVRDLNFKKKSEYKGEKGKMMTIMIAGEE